MIDQVKERYPDQPIEVDPLNPKNIVVPHTLVPEIFEWMKSDLQFDYFDHVAAIDRPPEHIDLVYSAYSYATKQRQGIKVRLDRLNPIVPSICHVWANADWNEREIYDLFGVLFTGHRDLRRLMMPDDWEGHPMRKDYMHPNLVRRPD